MTAILSMCGPGGCGPDITLVPIGHVFFAAAFFFTIGILVGLSVAQRLVSK